MRSRQVKAKAWFGVKRWLAACAAGLVGSGAAHSEEAAPPLATVLSSTTLSGYVSASAIWKFGAGNAALPGRSYDGPARQDGFNLDVVNLVLERPLADSGWSAGYKVDLLFGPDANLLVTTSTLPPGGLGNSDFAIKQAHLAFHIPAGNGLDLRLGVWDTIIGYEVFNAGSNPNYSRSYAYFLEPGLHTGLLASYRVNDALSLAAGVADGGANNIINFRSATESEKTYLGQITLTAPESLGALKGASLTAVVIDHASAGGPGSSADVVNCYVGGNVPTPLAGLTIGAAYDYRGNSRGPGAASAHAAAASLYTLFRATSKLAFNARAEYATGSAGAWYGTAPGARNELFGFTFTVDYGLWANVLSRVEFRWDHELHGRGVFGDGTDINALSLGLNVVYKF